MTTTERPRVHDAGTVFLPPDRGRDALAEALHCIVAGRALPAALRPAPVRVPAPATVEAGLAAILAGPAGPIAARGDHE